MTQTSVPRCSQATIEKWVRDLYGLETTSRLLPSYRDQNFCLQHASGRQLVFKLANRDEPRLVLDFQNQALRQLAIRRPELPVPRVLTTLDGAEITAVEVDGERFQARLLTHLPGKLMAAAAPCSPALLRRLGGLLAEVDQALADFTHPAMHRQQRWDLRHALAVRDEALAAVADAAQRRRVAEIFHYFERRALPLWPALRQSVIHGDGNDYNVLIEDDDEIVGLIDFGDLAATATVCEVAVAMTYAMMDRDDPLAAGAAVLAGYHDQWPLDACEVDLLPCLISTRLAVSVSLSAYERRRQPQNEYLSVSEAPAWRLLDQLEELPSQEVQKALRAACGARLGAVASGRSREQIQSLRRQHIGASLSVSYRQPLSIVRGAGAFLIDDQGQAYLDGVNNVCHVGHSHPRVVTAAHRQMSLLNTNTRYLHDQLVEYAERLTRTLPEPLRVCYFVCSGSEANDLALRMARTHTGRHDALVVEGAYHGTTFSVVELSPYKFSGPGGSGEAPHIHQVPMPDGYRGLYRGRGPEVGRLYAAEVARVIAAVTAEGREIAAFFCESILGCGGQVVLPPGYLRGAFAEVREAGGVCIADEVQVGFGRVGESFWAFEAQGVVPDIVTLGKPIGNGHPLAAVVTTPEIATSFTNGMEYFNTFGGNPVSCAVGLAVLDVIEEEGLQENARRVGAYLHRRLDSLASRHPLIGEVRGLGLFLGIELVRDRQTLAPAAAEADEIVQRMKDRGVLLSTDGPLHNVIKIKPPIVFSRAHADQLVDCLDEVLRQL